MLNEADEADFSGTSLVIAFSRLKMLAVNFEASLL